MSVPLLLFDTAQIRQLEADAISRGVSGHKLMRRAAAAAFAVLRQQWPEARSVTVVCGGGNNGGDGFALAVLLRASGCDVRVLLVANAESLPEEAADAYREMRKSGVEPLPFDAVTAATLLAAADIVVDALLGIGMRAPLKPPVLRAIAAINASGRPVLSLDLPSGLDPDRGTAATAVEATVTLSFIGWKQGLFLADGPAYCGDLHLDTLQLDQQVGSAAASMRRITRADLASVLPARLRNSHKGMFGRVLVVGGGAGMPGAVRLAGEAALRCGAGLVTIASLPQHESIVLGARPELMFRGIVEAAGLASLLPTFDVVAIGPGLGQDSWAEAILETVLSARIGGQSLVIDADALNLLARCHAGLRRDDWVLTPHPGEAGTLLGRSTAEVQADRPAALSALLQQRGGVVVLKGAGTLAGQTGVLTRLCDRGNPGMAVPGMGDVLTGAIAGVLAQHREPFAAAAAAVFLHATAGDHCATQGERGMLALEVATALRDVLAAEVT